MVLVLLLTGKRLQFQPQQNMSHVRLPDRLPRQHIHLELISLREERSVLLIL